MVLNFEISVIITWNGRRHSLKNETIIHFKFEKTLSCSLNFIINEQWDEPLFVPKCRQEAIVSKEKVFFPVSIHCECSLERLYLERFCHSVHNFFYFSFRKFLLHPTKAVVVFCVERFDLRLVGCASSILDVFVPNSINWLLFIFGSAFVALQFTTAIVMFTMTCCFFGPWFEQDWI